MTLISNGYENPLSHTVFFDHENTVPDAESLAESLHASQNKGQVRA
jgi:hypothetical protein